MAWTGKRLVPAARAGLVLAVSLFIGAAAQSAPQQDKTTSKPKSGVVPDDRARTTTVAEEIDAAPTGGYVQPKRDPFEIPSRRPLKVEPPPQVRAAPPLQERLRRYAELRNQLRALGETPPPAVSAYLVSELEVNGVFKDTKGYGAFVTAKPTNSTFFVRSGEKVFDGSIEKIEPLEVRFREVTLMTNGKNILKDVSKPILPAGK